jgi:DNA-binding response OmpR family regulator
MPDYNGVRLFFEIKKATSAPIIVMTDIGSEEVIRKGYEAGILDYLPKDKMTPELLTRTVLTHRATIQKQEFTDLLAQQRARELSTLTSIIELAKAKIAEHDQQDHLTDSKV